MAKAKKTKGSESGWLDRSVESREDFEEFLDWLEHSGKKEERKAAYLAFAEREGMDLGKLLAERGDEEFLVEAKAGLINRAAGKYVESMLSRSNKVAKIGMHEESSPETVDLCEKEVSEAKSQLSGFFAACAREIFSAQMRAARMSEAAVEGLVKALDQSWALDPLKAIVAGARRAEESQGEELASAFASYLASPATRATMLRTESVEPDAKDLERLGEFAPLLRFMGERLQKQERAEMLAKMLAYVDSGWASKDLVEGESQAAMAKSSPWSAHEGLEEWRAVARELKEGRRVEKDRVLNAFAGRLGDVMAKVKVDKGAKGAPTVASASMLGNSAKSWAEVMELAGSKEIDVCVISPGGAKVTLVSATSDPKMLWQGTQSERYLTAVESAFAKEPWSLGGIDLPRKPEVEMVVFSPCLAQTRLNSKGRQAGENFFSALRSKPSPEAEARMAELVNAMPMIETASEAFAKRGSIGNVRQVLGGGSAKVWDGIEAAAKASLAPLDAAQAGMCRAAAELMGMLTEHKFRSKAEGTTFTKNIEPTASGRVMWGLFGLGSRLAERALQEKVERKGAPEGLREALPEFCDRLESFANAALPSDALQLKQDLASRVSNLREWAAAETQPQGKAKRARKKG